MRKTLIGVLASILLLLGSAGQAVAQETDTDTTTTDTTDDGTDTTTTDTTTTDTTTDDGTDTTTTDTTTTDTTTDDGTDTTTTDTTTTDTTTDATADDGTDTTTTDTTATDTTQVDGGAVAGQGEASIAGSFAVEEPNPQPGLPATPADPAAQAAPAAADQVLGESELAFTGPDTRVMALAGVLLGSGALFVIASRRRDEELQLVDSWLD